MVQQYLRGNPALESYEQTTDTYRARAADDRRTAIEDTEIAQTQGLDRAIRSGLGSVYATGPRPEVPSAPMQGQQTGSMGGSDAGQAPRPAGGTGMAPPPSAPSYSDPVMGALLSAPGGGQAALSYHGSLQDAQAQQQDRMDEMEKLAVQALARGDMVTYRYYASRSGLQLPPGVEAAAGASRAGTASSRMWGRALELAERYYKDDPQQATAFIQAYTQSNGDLGMAITTAGIPQSRPDLTIQTIMVDGQRVLAAIDQDTGTFGHYVTGPDGQPLQDPGPGTGSAANTDSVFQTTARQILADLVEADPRNTSSTYEQKVAEAQRLAGTWGGGQQPSAAAPAPPAMTNSNTGAAAPPPAAAATTQINQPPTGIRSSEITPADVAMLRGDPSPQNRAEFDEYFGAGAAAWTLGEAR